MFPSSGEAGMKDFALTCALLFARQYAAAAPLAKEIFARWTPVGDPVAPILLAWAYQGSGRPRDALPLVERNPVPQPAGLSPFTTLWFPRVFFLRAEAFRAAGKGEEARRAARLFLDLSGPTPTLWGEEQRARAVPAR